MATESLNYNHLYYFHVVASEGSVARAAERLGVTQPTVSEQVKQLERVLDTSLFDRTGSGMRITEAGRQAFEHTSVMFRAGERLVEALGRAPLTEGPTLRIGVSLAASRAVAPGFFFPLITLDDCMAAIHRGELSQLFTAFHRRDLDLVIAEAAPIDAARRGVKVVDVCRPALVAVASPALQPDAAWENVSIMHYSPASAYRGEVDCFLESRQLRPAIIASSDDPGLMLEVAIRGHAIAFIPDRVARHAIGAGMVRMVATLEPGPLTLHAIYHEPGTPAMVEAVAALVRSAADPALHGF